MKHLERFFWQKDTHLSENDVERILSIIDTFADDNNMVKDVVWDLPDLKEIKYQIRYNSRAELGDAINNNTDINFKVYCNNREKIYIDDIFGRMNLDDNSPEGNRLMDKMLRLYNTMKIECPHLKFKMPKGSKKWNVIITTK